jgi:hypothetical protein
VKSSGRSENRRDVAASQSNVKSVDDVDGLLPKLCRPHHLVADRGCVVDQDVDAAVVAFDLSEQSLGLLVVSVIDSDGDALAAGCGHHRRRVADGA